MKMITLRIKSISLAAVMLSAIMSGCGNSPFGMETELPGDSRPVAISIRDASIESELTDLLSPSTRGTVSSGSMGVYLSSAGGYIEKNNAQYTYSGGWGSTGPIYVGGTNASLYAYYPYDSSLGTTAAKPAVTLTARNNTANAGFWYAAAQTGTVSNTQPGVSFAMSQAYSMIRFNIKRNNSGDTAYPNACKVSALSIAPQGGIYTTGTVDITRPIAGYTNPKTSGGATATFSSFTLPARLTNGLSAGATVTVEHLFPPQSFGGTTALSMTVDGMKAVAEIPNSSFKDLAAGKYITINIDIQKFKVIISITSATDGGYTTGSDISGEIEV